MTLPVAVLLVGVSGPQQNLLRPLLLSDDLTVIAVHSIVSDSSVIDSPDLIIIDAANDESAAAGVTRLARRRWTNPTMLCLDVGNAAAAVELFDAGADHVVMRSTAESIVVALISAAVRRIRIANAQLRVTFGDLVYDREARRVWCAGKEVVLTPRELRLFDILFLRAGNACSAETLQAYVWHDEQPTKSNSLAVYIGYLRRKLSGSRASVLETLRGSGYRLARRKD